jgi:predicted nucleic acid-binding protein
MAKALTSLRLDDRLVKRAQKAVGAKSRTQIVEMSLEAVVETEKHRNLIKRYSEKRGPATLSAANLAIFDTSVYIDNLRSGRFKSEILDLKFVVRCSAVVLAELFRGTRSGPMKRFVDDLAKKLRVIAPNDREWVESERVVNRLVATKGYDIRKTREIHVDVQIALTARRIGTYLITCNVQDFTAVRRFINFNLVCW